MDMDMEIGDVLRIFWPLILLQLAVTAFALIDLVRREKVKHLPKIVWGVIIIANVIGAIIYFVIGREEV